MLSSLLFSFLISWSRSFYQRFLLMCVFTILSTMLALFSCPELSLDSFGLMLSSMLFNFIISCHQPFYHEFLLMSVFILFLWHMRIFMSLFAPILFCFLRTSGLNFVLVMFVFFFSCSIKHECYRCYDIVARCIHTSRDVTFFERIPYHAYTLCLHCCRYLLDLCPTSSPDLSSFSLSPLYGTLILLIHYQSLYSQKS